MRGENYNKLSYAAVMVVGLLLGNAILPAAAQDKKVLGVTETVRLEPEGVLVDAKLDTGGEYVIAGCAEHSHR